jgi:hypothetical protein
MSTSVEIKRVVEAVEMAEGAGATVRRVFPTDRLRHVDPFVLLDEFTVTPPAAFPEHPHGGFEAVTYMLEGAFRHRDDLGNDETVSAGGVQRFTAGKRLVHSEMPGSEETSHGLQLWVNLPRELKDTEPSYQPVSAGEIPETTEGGARVRTVVGEDPAGKASPVELHTEMVYLEVELPAGEGFEYEVPDDWSGLVYVLEGRVAMDERSVARGKAAIFESGGRLVLGSEEGGRAAIIAGRPHEQPIRQRGSFVD